MDDKAREAEDQPDVNQWIGSLGQLREEIARAVIGQRAVVDQLLIALVCGGHVLLEGAPGLGKTLLVQTLGRAAGLDFARVQFTPDLMPADITGGLTLVPDASNRPELSFQPGPIFTQVLLADEINRATPKTQSALLEAMQERTVTIGGKTRALPQPFFVLATQNPIEMEGTYLLPEAQIDRFLFKTLVAYPSETELENILDLTSGAGEPVPHQVLSARDVLNLQSLVRQVPVASHVRKTVARFAIATQPHLPESAEVARRYLRYGLSPRGAQALLLAAKGHALFAGRYNVAFDDLEAMLMPVVRHRLQLNYHGESGGIDAPAALQTLLADKIREAR